jgi:hypothetical protein
VKVEIAELENAYLVLENLAKCIEDRLLSWITSLSVPNRTGWHDNTAFALKLIIESKISFPDLYIPAITKSLELFYQDTNLMDDLEERCPFLSPTLCELELMTHILSLSSYTEPNNSSLDISHPPSDLLTRMFDTNTLTAMEWLQRNIAFDMFCLSPTCNGDPQDGYKSHLCGLNFSRVWNYASIGVYLLQSHRVTDDGGVDIGCFPLVTQMYNTAKHHFDLSVPFLCSGHFMGDHWLATFAIRAMRAINTLIDLMVSKNMHFIKY